MLRCDMLWPMAPWPRVRDWNDSAQPLTLGRPWGPWATRRAHFSWLSISLGSRSEDSVICKASDCNATRRWNTYENIMKQHWNNKEQLTLDIYWNIMILYIYIIILLSGILTPCAMCLMCLIGRLQLVSIAWTQAKWWKTTWGTLCAKSESDRIWPNVYI